MLVTDRARRVAGAVVMVALALLVGACAREYPNTTFARNTDFGRAIDDLWDRLLFWGVIVFVVVEIALLITIIRYRQRRGAPPPRHVHGNTLVEIIWTLIPAAILVFIAVPTVRTIFITQQDAPVPGTVQVEVIGHQWWWEFRYPQYDFVTANELYVPIGRTVSFVLKTADVLHSFWVPQMGGKRDLISNHTNYLWFTPDSAMLGGVWNGACVEYCGASHANMRFRLFTVTPEEFERWVALQRRPPAFEAVDPYAFPASRLNPHNVPSTPIPDGLALSVPPESGDRERGREVYSRSACIGCHVIQGNPSSVGLLGPSLTHIASRTTIGAGLYPNTPRHLALWIKNSQRMKPGSLMPPQGKDEQDAKTGLAGTLTDEQIADIVAYLGALR